MFPEWKTVVKTAELGGVFNSLLNAVGRDETKVGFKSVKVMLLGVDVVQMNSVKTVVNIVVKVLMMLFRIMMDDG